MRAGTVVWIVAATALFRSDAAATERIAMPLGAFVCRTIEPVIEHARIVRQPTTAGLREFVEAQERDGRCRRSSGDATVTVLDVDKRGFALIDHAGLWWTDAENLWGYFDTPARVKAWPKP